MAWKIEITRTAEKQITKLNKASQALIVRFLKERLKPAENPRGFGRPLHGDKAGLWRYRVGVYRLICEIQDQCVKILVLKIGHRKDVYR